MPERSPWITPFSLAANAPSLDFSIGVALSVNLYLAIHTCSSSITEYSPDLTNGFRESRIRSIPHLYRHPNGLITYTYRIAFCFPRGEVHFRYLTSVR